MRQEQYSTPFGTATLTIAERDGTRVVFLSDEPNPHAAVYAAKDLGATRVIELVMAQPLDRLIEPGDLVVPNDLVDLTDGRRSTLFANKGYGFISQRPAFCPELREVLVVSAREAGKGRVFTRGVLAVAEGWEQSSQADLWGAHVLSLTAAPATYLAKELELCYAPLCMIASLTVPDWPASLLELVLDRLPPARACPCQVAMQPARQRGLIGNDWKTWL